MSEIKCVVNDVKAGKSYQKAVDSGILSGRKIGDKLQGDHLGLSGYELQITGGSDNAGFPMRKEIEGSSRKKPLLGKSIGFKIHRKGMFKRKTIVGGGVGNSTAQINLKVVKYGAKAISELFSAKDAGEEKKE
jgi:small subunit ribosomal protein S6e